MHRRRRRTAYGGNIMFYWVTAAVIVGVTLLTVYAATHYNSGIFKRGFNKDIYEYSDQQLLYALDKVVIKYHSIELHKLDDVLGEPESGMSALYWCDLTRLYAFSAENEVFLSFLNSLSDAHWQRIIGSYSEFKLQQVRAVAEEVYNSKGNITLAQSEHFRYSIRDANSRMQEELCFYVRHNIDRLK